MPKKLTLCSPIYFDPTFDECVELGRNSWDTLRLCVLDDKDIPIKAFGVASGYGNDHYGVIRAMRDYYNNRHMNAVTLSTYIIYRVHGHLFFNMEDVSGHERVAWRDAKEYFCTEHWQWIRDILVTAEESTIKEDDD